MTDKVAQLNYWNSSEWRYPPIGPPEKKRDMEMDRKAKESLRISETKEGDNLLILGCGPGYELWNFAERIKEGKIVCIEPSDLIDRAKEITEIASKKYGTEINLIKGFAEDVLNDINEKFDDAIGVDVHRYLQDPVSVYKKTMDLIKEDGGIVILNTELYPSHDCYKLIINNAFDTKPFEKLNSEYGIGISKLNHALREVLFYLQRNVPEEDHEKHLKKIKRIGNYSLDAKLVPL
jgi:SAM-dependent methyltransferase